MAEALFADAIKAGVEVAKAAASQSGNGAMTNPDAVVELIRKVAVEVDRLMREGRK